MFPGTTLIASDKKKTFIKLGKRTSKKSEKLKMLKRHKFLGRKATSAHRKKTQYQQKVWRGKKSSHSFSATLNCPRATAKKFCLFFSFFHSEKKFIDTRKKDENFLFASPSTKNKNTKLEKRQWREC